MNQASPTSGSSVEHPEPAPAADSEALAKTGTKAPACTIVIFGANGDLTKRLLMPALYNLSGAKLLDDDFSVVGVDRDASTDAEFQGRQKESMASFTPDKAGEFAEDALKPEWWDWLEGRLHYLEGDFTADDVFQALGEKLGDGNAIFYLAVADKFFTGIIDSLDAAGLTKAPDGKFRRLIIEKPFGHDLASAKALNEHILSKLGEEQIYRIDHFLGKETVQNIMALRFGNGIFERMWDRHHIDSVQITAAETVGVEGRGKFYETTGALRDMVPNHMFQLLAMIAMEAPATFDADAVRSEKAKVIEAIRPFAADDVEANVVRGQYAAGHSAEDDVPAYATEPDVAPDTAVETYVAVRLMIDNDRWQGVPFCLRTGKRMASRTTEIAIQFKASRSQIFDDKASDGLAPNVMLLHLQPHEGISLGFSAKQPGQTVLLKPVEMGFKYGEYFDLKPATGYETLIYDVLLGDPMLFNRADNIEAGWQAVQPIIDAVAKGGAPIRTYQAGSEGPTEADALLADDGLKWRALR